ncbi:MULTISPECIES: ornithine cyclodeaminase family protein [Bacillus]|uniref:Delta(1)-pyrroline-2-carboxylate reductase n=2 Tax=Bacillus cereus group TaxID=86661 RepID=A0A2A7DBP6_BACAN|nr:MULTISPECIES: ornithine cyclodeaminase family protein [Bacillus]MDC7973526.1 ornithine cyclodeaminase family protein [Bacillus sp. BLCC-B18]OTW67544.1 ornithine cyclodeaminase [Bacillus thuringiensis serovar coreanensis]OTX44160.1 ornithine cyclodeaminase [Bacillus thuringiensis serovar sooncheon]OTX53324.1 ornithine cyclodeaminase [Bacillus thuringiensis serovar guiyangiensis]OTX67645.1 ornithine cyclodeaminase [Bacillus thuringiensis serovar roskildiensis]
MLVISANEQRNLVNMNEVIEYAALALKEFSAERTITPIRGSLPFANEQNTALIMPSVAEGLKALGLKVVTVVPENKKIGKKTINGIVMLSDFQTGEPLALLEGSYLTMIRTGALSGVSTKYLARHNAKTLCIIGTGEQAKGIAEAVFAVRDIEKVILYNRTEEKAYAFAQYIQETFNKPAYVYASPDEAISEADIIVTTTNASTPVFTKKLQKGVHVNAVGSFRPSMQELPSHAIANANKVVVESKEAALEETGDLQVPVREGLFEANDIHAELGQIISGERAGRENDEEITVFKSVGLAVVDIIVAKYLYERAVENGVGNRIEF